jgi:hypothetical protein
MKKLIFIIYILPFYFVSCEKKLDIDLPDTEKHIVVNGMINPDSLLEVRVSKSRNILDTNAIEHLSDALVKLFVNGVFIQDLTSSGDGFFTSGLFPEINKEYAITVDYPGLRTVHTQCRIKEASPIMSIDTLREIVINDWGYGEIDTTSNMKFDIRFNDNAATNDFYFLAISSLQPIYEYIDTVPNITGYHQVSEYFNTQDLVFRSNTNDFSIEGFHGKVFSDELFNGNSYTIQLELFLSSSGDIYAPEQNLLDSTMFYVRLYSVNQDFFRFVNSYNLNQSSEYDPFSQPVQIFSNVENGLGLFTGYSVDIDSLIIRY